VAKQLGPEQVALFCENMGMMYQAGIQTGEAVQLIAQDSGASGLQTALNTITKRIEEDYETLPVALREEGSFPAHAVKMIEIAEQSGRLEETMFALGDYYLGQKRFQDRMRSALLYPMILLVLMTIVLLILAVQVLPIFSEVYASMAGQVSTASLAYAQAAQTISYVAVVIVLIVGIFFLVGACFAYFGKQTTTVSRMFDTLPFTANVSYTSALARAMTAFATFSASGISPEDALASITGEIGNKKLRQRFEASTSLIAEGQSFAQAAFENNVLEPLYGRMLINSERSGTFDNTLAYLATIISEDSERQTDQLVSTIEPVCAAFLTVAVALALIAIVVPLVGILGAMG